MKLENVEVCIMVYVWIDYDMEVFCVVFFSILIKCFFQFCVLGEFEDCLEGKN